MKPLINFIKRSIGDILSLFFGWGDENYEPTKEHYQFFFAIVIMLVILTLTI